MLRRASLTVLLVVLLPATVQAFDHHEHHHHGKDSDGDGCGKSSESTHPSAGSASASADVPSSPPPLSSDHKRVFVTSTTFSGAIGGLTAADDYCQSSAIARGLQGKFGAWLSDAKNSAYDRTGDVGPWYTTNDELAFSTKADLHGGPTSPLLDENGRAPEGAGSAGAATAWTGSDSAGVATGHDCEGWTNATVDVYASTGSLPATDAKWAGEGAALRCNAKAPLICFQQ